MIRIVPTTILVLLLSSCKGSEGPTGPQGPAGQNGSPGPGSPALLGSLSGYVVLHNFLGGVVAPSTAETVAIQNRTVPCDTNGRWMLDSLTTGVYDIVFQYNGYGTYTKKTYQFVGGGDVFYGIVTLAQIPSFRVNSLNAAISQSGVTVSGSVTSPPPQGTSYFVAVYVGHDSTVSSDPTRYQFSVIGYTDIQSFGVVISSGDFLSAGFGSGSKAYLVAYGCADGSAYYGSPEGGISVDPATGRYIRTGLSAQVSPISVVSFP